MLCPLQLWVKFLPQVELTLNLLRFSCCNPQVSANQELYGLVEFNKTPLAPLGTKALVYDDPAMKPPRRRMQPTVSTLAWPSITTVVFASTFH
jgi:hypothetical protein